MTARAATSPERRESPAASRRRWRVAGRIASALFVLLVVATVYWYAREIEWGPVLEAIRAYRPSTLVLAAAAAVLSCVLYASYDLLTRPHAREGLSWRWVMPVAFTAYSFNVNLGPWIGSFGMRLRQYVRLGLGSAQVLRILAFSTLTNWVGYVAIAGLVFAIQPPAVLPADWPIGAGTLRASGVVLVAAALGYCVACAIATRRVFAIRKMSLRLPSLRLALVQIALAATHWALLAAVPWVLLGGAAGYPIVLATMMLAAVAGAMLHIPGGIGVIEAVVLAMLGRDVPQHQLLAMLLVYRATYYLLPFAVGIAIFAALEALIRRRGPART